MKQNQLVPAQKGDFDRRCRGKLILIAKAATTHSLLTQVDTHLDGVVVGGGGSDGDDGGLVEVQRVTQTLCP